MSNKLFLVPIAAHEAASGLAKVAKDVAPDISVRMHISTPINQIGFETEALGAALEDHNALKVFVGETASLVGLACSSAALRAEGNQQEAFSVVYTVEDTETFFRVEKVNDRSMALKLISSLQRHFKLMPRGRVLGLQLPAEDQAAIAFKEQVVGELASEVSRLGVFMTEMTKKNVEETRRLAADLETQYQERRTQLDAEVRAQREELDKARREFEQAKAAFDDRQRTHVRRDLLQKIQTNIQERASATGISPSVKGARTLIHVMSGMAMLIGLCVAFFAGYEIYRSAGQSPFDWRLVPMFSVGALLFTVTMIFYFRWNSQWADRLAHHDFANEQYASDILRASWIAELLFEYKDEREKEIPPEVVTRLTEGLFRPETFRSGRYHPSDDFAAFVNRIRKIDAGPEGVKIEAQK